MCSASDDARTRCVDSSAAIAAASGFPVCVCSTEVPINFNACEHYTTEMERKRCGRAMQARVSAFPTVTVAGLDPILYTPNLKSPAPPDSRPPPVAASRTSAPFPRHDTPAAAMPIQYRARLRIGRSGGRRATVPLLHGATVCNLLLHQLHLRLVLEQ